MSLRYLAFGLRVNTNKAILNFKITKEFNQLFLKDAIIMKIYCLNEYCDEFKRTFKNITNLLDHFLSRKKLISLIS